MVEEEKTNEESGGRVTEARFASVLKEASIAHLDQEEIDAIFPPEVVQKKEGKKATKRGSVMPAEMISPDGPDAAGEAE